MGSVKEEKVDRYEVSPLTLEALFAGKSPADWRAIYKDAFDWGEEDVGRESVDE